MSRKMVASVAAVVGLSVAGAVPANAQSGDTTGDESAPEPIIAVTANAMATLDQYLSTIYQFGVAGHAARYLWLELALGVGSAGGFDAGDAATSDESLFEVKTGGRYERCRRAFCYGGGLNLGYQREEHMAADYLIDPNGPWEVRRHRVFVEARGIVGARLGAHFELQLALGSRANFATVHRRAPAIELGPLVMFGMLAMF